MGYHHSWYIQLLWNVIFLFKKHGVVSNCHQEETKTRRNVEFLEQTQEIPLGFMKEREVEEILGWL